MLRFLLQGPLRRFAGSRGRQPSARRCILHVGSPKTATSSIQFVLKKHRRGLLQHRILVPRSGQTATGSHRYLAFALAGLPIAHGEATREAFAREVLASDCETVLISSEFLWDILTSASRAEALIEPLRALGLDVTIQMYVRNQPQWMNSFYQHYANFRRNEDFEGFVKATLARPKWYLYSFWTQFAAQHGVQLLVRPFSQDVRRSGVVEDFLTTVGVAPLDSFDTTVARNRSIGPFRVSVAQTLMREVVGSHKLSEPQVSICRRALRREMTRRNIVDRDYCGLTTSVAALIEKRFGDDNERFAQKVWGRSWQQVFAGDVGQRFEPNDYAMTGVPAERRHMLAEVLDSVEPEIRAVLAMAS